MDLEVLSPISAEAEVKAYTLVGDDIYVKRYTNENIPDWYRQLISDIIATDNTITDLDAAVDYLSTLPAGYDQKITELQLADTTINTSLTSLVATTGSHTAAIASLNATKVDATSAAAIAQTTVGSYFASADAGAWFNSKISTYASDIAANAMDISTLSATVDGQTVMIEDISSVSIDPVTGYMLGASKIGTAPDGSITGWQFADGTNVQSSFKIMATNFSVSDGTTGYTPFSISGNNVLFNGVVDFTNTNTYGTTTIDGGRITTGSVATDQLAAGAVTTSRLAVGAGIVNGYMQSSDFTTIGGAGFRLKSNAAGTSTDPTIYGAYIRGSTIQASTLDYSSVQITAQGFLNNYGSISVRSINSNIQVGSISVVYAYSDYFYGRGYGTGFLKNRICKASQEILISSTGISRPYSGTNSLGFISTDIEYSINDGAWIVLASGTFNVTALYNSDLGSNYIRFRTKAYWSSNQYVISSYIDVTSIVQ